MAYVHDENRRKKVAAIITVAAAATAAVAAAYLLLDISRKPHVNRNGKRKRCMKSTLYDDDLPQIDEDMSRDDLEEVKSGACIGKRPLSSAQKSQQDKKLRRVKVVKDMINGLNARIDTMLKSTDYLAFSKDLYAEVMKVEGFSHQYLDTAFALLRKDALEGEIFLVRDVESRKKMLEKLREKIGDV